MGRDNTLVLRNSPTARITCLGAPVWLERSDYRSTDSQNLVDSTMAISLTRGSSFGVAARQGCALRVELASVEAGHGRLALALRHVDHPPARARRLPQKVLLAVDADQDVAFGRLAMCAAKSRVREGIENLRRRHPTACRHSPRCPRRSGRPASFQNEFFGSPVSIMVLPCPMAACFACFVAPAAGDGRQDPSLQIGTGLKIELGRWPIVPGTKSHRCQQHGEP